jgi:hypothetical protein
MPGPAVGLRCHHENVSPAPGQRARARQIARQLAQISFARPGILTDRLTRCGRANISASNRSAPVRGERGASPLTP